MNNICSSFLPGTLFQLYHRAVEPKPSMMVSLKWDSEIRVLGYCSGLEFTGQGTAKEATVQKELPRNLHASPWAPLTEYWATISQGETLWGLAESPLQAWELNRYQKLHTAAKHWNSSSARVEALLHSVGTEAFGWNAKI